MASQAAISIKNSMLYEELEGTVRALHTETVKRKQAQIQLLHADKLSAMGRISASIAHEFGNPLIGIKYLLDDLTNRSHLSDEDHHLIEVGLEECDRMKKLMDDLHDLHRPSSGLKSRFNLNESVKNVLLFQRKSFKNSGVSVITELADDLPDIVAIEDQITQVIVNMAINGGDAMAKKGGVLSIKTTHDRKVVTLKISDTGHGITPENQEHIFEPFFSTKEEMDGTGLGLAIAYSIVKSHGGDIAFTSVVGEGSTFTIHLPINASSTTDAGASDRLQLDHLPVQQLANLHRQNQ
jgi:signal transduction histidine kinase